MVLSQRPQRDNHKSEVSMETTKLCFQPGESTNALATTDQKSLNFCCTASWAYWSLVVEKNIEATLLCLVFGERNERVDPSSSSRI